MISKTRPRDRLWQVLRGFTIEGAPGELTKIYVGNIHDSYVSTWKGTGKKYLHQWVNRTVFPDIDALMGNIVTVTQHIRQKLDEQKSAEQTLTLIPSRDGLPGIVDSEGSFWRTYEFIENTDNYNVCRNVEQASEAARMFGSFVRNLIDLNPRLLKETIPFFQHTPHRPRQLAEAEKRDPAGRVEAARFELDFVQRRRRLAHLIVDEIRAGRLPER
jgi:hypothetical protein